MNELQRGRPNHPGLGSAASAFSGGSWYVYVGHDYEGPMDSSEIIERIRTGELTSAHYLWSVGLGDWTVIRDLAEFAPALLEAPRQGRGHPKQVYGDELPDLPELPRPDQSVGSTSPVPAIAGIASAIDVAARTESDFKVNAPQTFWPVLEYAYPGSFSTPEFRSLPLETPLHASQGAVESAPGAVSSAGRSKKILGFAAVFTLAGLALGVSFMFDGGARHDIPPIAELSAEDNVKLKSVAGEPTRRSGPRVAFAVSKNDRLTPAFYVATNLPDGARFVVTVESVDGTLMDKREISVRTVVTTKRGIAKTNAFRQPDGRPYPAGEYQIYVTDSPSNPSEIQGALAGRPDIRPKDASEKLPSPVRLISAEKTFLGGDRDSSYEVALKEFNARLREQAQMELMELRQYAETLENQLTRSTDMFHRVLYGNSDGKAWVQFHFRWLGLQKGLNRDLESISSPQFESDYFYSKLYRMVSETAQSMDVLHQSQDAFVSTSRKNADAESKIAADGAVLQSQILNIKAKLAQVSALPVGPTGAPQRK